MTSEMMAHRRQKEGNMESTTIYMELAKLRIQDLLTEAERARRARRGQRTRRPERHQPEG
jgi:hypothetical protein